jgi:hypothetical protein
MCSSPISQEFNTFTALQAGMFAFGIVLIFAGVVLLTSSAVKPSVRKPEPLPAEEVCGWCISG